MNSAAAPLLAGCIAAEAARELCFKHAAGRFAGALDAGAWLRATSIPALWCGLVLWAGEMLLWIVTLEHVPLGLAFPLMALSYAVTPLAGRLFLGERLAGGQIAGVALVACGAACVGMSGL